MTKSTDREIFHYTAGTLNPGGMPPTEISLLIAAAKLIAGKELRDEQEKEDQQAALKHIHWAIQCLRAAEGVKP